MENENGPSVLMAELQSLESVLVSPLLVHARQSFRPFRPIAMCLHPKVVSRLYYRT